MIGVQSENHDLIKDENRKSQIKAAIEIIARYESLDRNSRRKWRVGVDIYLDMIEPLKIIATIRERDGPAPLIREDILDEFIRKEGQRFKEMMTNGGQKI